MKLKKKLKDPNEKSAIQKFVGGKIPHYLAVAAFLICFCWGRRFFTWYDNWCRE
tara:strand:+ start:191 stop:352 length:162 start_codon:yes stop_codon:yes gene_type:complete